MKICRLVFVKVRVVIFLMITFQYDSVFSMHVASSSPGVTQAEVKRLEQQALAKAKELNLNLWSNPLPPVILRGGDQPITLAQYPVVADGDCGFHALGFSRDSFLTKLGEVFSSSGNSKLKEGLKEDLGNMCNPVLSTESSDEAFNHCIQSDQFKTAMLELHMGASGVPSGGMMGALARLFQLNIECIPSQGGKVSIRHGGDKDPPIYLYQKDSHFTRLIPNSHLKERKQFLDNIIHKSVYDAIIFQKNSELREKEQLTTAGIVKGLQDNKEKYAAQLSENQNRLAYFNQLLKSYQTITKDSFKESNHNNQAVTEWGRFIGNGKHASQYMADLLMKLQESKSVQEIQESAQKINDFLAYEKDTLGKRIASLEGDILDYNEYPLEDSNNIEAIKQLKSELKKLEIDRKNSIEKASQGGTAAALQVSHGTTPTAPSIFGAVRSIGAAATHLHARDGGNDTNGDEELAKRLQAEEDKTLSSPRSNAGGDAGSPRGLPSHLEFLPGSDLPGVVVRERRGSESGGSSTSRSSSEGAWVQVFRADGGGAAQGGSGSLRSHSHSRGRNQSSSPHGHGGRSSRPVEPPNAVGVEVQPRSSSPSTSSRWGSFLSRVLGL